MSRFIVSGIGTDVGKTVVSTILTMTLDGEYWKPIQCGNDDQMCVERFLKGRTHSPLYSFKASLSPHHAARLEKCRIKKLSLPKTDRPLVIEGVGGVLVPLTKTSLAIDLFKSWDAKWIVVSKHYLGSINHTLLTIEALKKRKIPIFGIIFNGIPNRDSEEAILKISKVPLLGRLLPEPNLDLKTFQKYVRKWRHLISGIPLHK